MIRRIAVTLVPLAVLAFAPAARAGSSIEIDGFGGWQSLVPSNSGIADAIAGRGGTAIFGGDVLARIDWIGIGASLDKTVSGNAQPWAGSLMAGALIDPLPSFRIELLGEVGRRGANFRDIFHENGAMFVGARPGVSFRLLPSPVRIGAEALIRWPTSGGSFGSPDYGFVGKIGLEFP